MEFLSWEFIAPLGGWTKPQFVCLFHDHISWKSMKYVYPMVVFQYPHHFVFCWWFIEPPCLQSNRHFWWWNHFQWLRHQGVHPSGGVFDVPTVPTVVPTVIPRRRPRCTSTFTAPCVSCCPRCCRASMPRCSATSPRCGGRCSARRRDVWDAMGWMVRDGGNMWESYREI